MASSPTEFRYSSLGPSAAAKEIRTSSLANRSCRPSTRSPPRGRSVVRTCRGIRDKALLAHQFLGVQAAIGAAETHVALAGNLPGHPVVRHIVSFDAKIARPGRLAAAGRLVAAFAPAPVPHGFPARRGAPCVPRKAL